MDGTLFNRRSAYMKEQMQPFSGRSVEQRTARASGVPQSTDVDEDRESLVCGGNHRPSPILDPQMCKRPETRRDMSWLSAAESEHLLDDGTDPRAEIPRGPC